MTVEDCIEDERWGEWWLIQRVPIDAHEDRFAWRVVDVQPDCRECTKSLGKTMIDACLKALQKSARPAKEGEE